MLRATRTFYAAFRRSVPYLLVLLVLVSVALGSRGELAWAGPLSALTPAAAASANVAAAPPEEQVAPDSPRAAMTDFLKWTRHGEYAKAARYLDLSSVDESDGPLLAKHLSEVLERHLRIEPDNLSPDALGDTKDGLGADREELGNVPGAAGKPEPVVLTRQVDRTSARWVFSASTVGQIDDWYEHIENRWLLDHLPKPLLGFGPHELRWWQWLALGPLLVGCWLLGFAFTRLLRTVIRSTLGEHHPETMRRMGRPATLAWTVIACYALLPRLGLYEPAEAFVDRGLSAALLVAFFWALWRGVELAQHVVSTSQWARNSLTAHSLLMLGARFGKFAVAAFAFVAVLAELGYPVTSIITGLGIGGVALALAAQKTVENLFGAFSLAVDRPFREGDTIQVDSISGTVEAIGLRSTRIRTVDRTLITIPNGKLAEMRIETVSARERIRFYSLVGVVHSASAQIPEIIAEIEELLRQHPLVANDTISVRLVALTDSALNLELSALCATTDNNEFLLARQTLLLGTVQIIEKSGAKLARQGLRVELTAGTNDNPPAPKS
jgi:MscS family membrane protein